MELSENARQILEFRYLSEKENGEKERPEEMFRRVAVHVASVEKTKELRGHWAKEFFDLFENLDFLPNTPALINAGKSLGEMIACYVLPVEDSVVGIFDAVKDAAIIHKGGGGCISEGSYVITDKGIKKIEDIKVGDKVYSIDEKTGEFKISKVIQTHIYSTKDKRICKVNFQENSYSNVTDWHPFEVLTNRGIEQKQADELEKGDLVISGESREFKSIDNNYWLYGFIVSDGSFDNSINGERLRICKSYESTICKAADILGINYNLSKDKRYKVDVWELATVNSRILSKLQIFKYKGIWKKAQTAKIPERIWSSSFEQRASFVCGLFDGDASYNKDKGRIDYTTVSKKLAEEMVCLLSTIGIPSKFRVRYPKKEHWSLGYEVQIKCQLGIVRDILSLSCRYDIDKINFKSCDAIYFPVEFKKYFPFNTKTARKPIEIDGITSSLNQWYSRNKLAKSSAIHLLRSKDITDEKWILWEKYLSGAKKVKSVESCKDVKRLRDLTIENSGTYMAITMGSPVMIHNTGFSFSKIRPEGDKVKQTNGVASGPCSFLKVFDSATSAMKQGGVRRGANMGILNCDHPDIEKFIDLKKKEGTITNFNLSVAITDDFMQCLENNAHFFFKREGKQGRQIEVEKIWNKIIEGAWKNGEPGIIFIDQVNKKNELRELERIYASNPCAEQYLPDYGSCNLGSINLSNFVLRSGQIFNVSLASNILNHPKIDYGRLASTIKTAIRYLDNTIDASKYPLPEIEREAKKKRRVGLGIMGLADVFLKLGIRYGSDESLKLAEKIMNFVQETAQRESMELGKEKGVPEILRGVGITRRNGTLTTIAPTGSLSIIANCSSGCEPVFSYRYEKSCIDSILKIEHPLAKFYFARNEKLPDYFVAAKDIPMEEHIKMQSVLQKWIDSGISKTINAPKETTIEEVDKAFRLCYRSGCKSISFYREGSRSYEALVDEKSIEKKQEREPLSEILKRPRFLKGITEQVLTSRGRLYVTVNELFGKPFEVFLHIGKAGAEDNAYSEALGRLISLLLKSNNGVEKIVKHLINISGDSQVWDEGVPIKSVPDAVAKILSKRYLKSEKIDVQSFSDIVCPSCNNNSVVVQGGCDLCLMCGWTKCS